MDGPQGVAEAPLTLFCTMSALWEPREPLEASFHPCLHMAVYLSWSVLPPRSDSLNPSCKHRSGYLVPRPSLVYFEPLNHPKLDPWARRISQQEELHITPAHLMQVTPTSLNLQPAGPGSHSHLYLAHG